MNNLIQFPHDPVYSEYGVSKYRSTVTIFSNNSTNYFAIMPQPASVASSCIISHEVFISWTMTLWPFKNPIYWLLVLFPGKPYNERHSKGNHTWRTQFWGKYMAIMREILIFPMHQLWQTTHYWSQNKQYALKASMHSILKGNISFSTWLEAELHKELCYQLYVQFVMLPNTQTMLYAVPLDVWPHS